MHVQTQIQTLQFDILEAQYADDVAVFSDTPEGLQSVDSL